MRIPDTPLSEARLSRRDAGKAVAALGIGLAIGAKPSLAGRQPAGAPTASRDGSIVEKLGWDLGIQAWTFRDRSCFEAIDMVRKLGLKDIELFPGQVLSPGVKDVKVEAGMPPEHLKALRTRLADSGVTARCFGVVTFPESEAECRKQFDFAKSVGIATLTCEPEEKAWDVVARLADEYQINAACHDHPKPSRYWNPDAVLTAVKGRTKRVGFCADVGHWLRSGMVPVECLRKCEGRLISLHFKDVDAKAPGDSKPDVPFGRGQCDIPALMRELKRQNFKGMISIEYETGSGTQVDKDVSECIAFFDRTAAEIAGG